MSSFNPLLTGLAAAALVLLLTAIVAQLRRPLKRMRLRRRQRRYLRGLQRSPTSERTRPTNEEVYRSRAASERSLPMPTLGVDIELRHDDLQTSEADAARIIEEAERTAAELLQDAEHKAEDRVRAAELEGQRIAEDARRRAAEQLDEARLEARRILDDTGQERARLLSEVEHERALAEATHGKLRSLAAIEEATRTAETLLMVAEQRRVSMRRQIAKLLEAAIARLPATFRTVFVLREIEGLNVEETAEALQIPEETVKTRLFRARRRLQKELDPELCGVLSETFPFAGADCEAMTERVLIKFCRATKTI